MSTISIQTQQPAASPSHNEVVGRSAILIGSIAVMTLSILLHHGPQREDVMIPLLNIPLPPLCSFKRYTGLECAGCGLTRSFVSIGHGDFRSAFDFNAAGPLWFAIIALQIPYQTAQLIRIRSGKSAWQFTGLGRAVVAIAVVALLLQWVLKMTGFI